MHRGHRHEALLGRARPTLLIEELELSLLQIDFMVQGSYEPATVVGIVVAVLTVSVAVFARLFGSRYELR